ncbi:MAG TPA: hypothetical protein VIN59_05355 [Alphaproteobacteria bacterium]
MTDNTDTPPMPPTLAAGPDQGRYSLNDQGVISWQKDSTNPLPGDVVGQVVKGDALLAPKAETIDPALLQKTQDWLAIHVRQVLEPLFLLKGEGEGALTGAAAEIGNKLFEHLGVMHRSDLDKEIAALDSDLRKALRARGVRLGPVLVFLPALVKPAAVRLRALLWGIWNGKTLPVHQPADGRVSEVIDPANVDRHFYRMIGYPVFGPRAIRIDMLDRVVTDVYDTADKGVFEAKHKYAEWLGTNLDDLHAVLESMGHRKLKGEAAPVVTEPVAEKVVAEASAAQTPALEAAAAEEPAVETPLEAAAAMVESVAPKAIPVVQKFFLKRGKMSERPVSRHPKPHHKPEEKTEHRSADKPKFDPNKYAKKKDFKKDGEKSDRPRKKFDRNEDRDRGGRTYTFEAKKTDNDDDNNPFAILKNYKK